MVQSLSKIKYLFYLSQIILQLNRKTDAIGLYCWSQHHYEYNRIQSDFFSCLFTWVSCNLLSRRISFINMLRTLVFFFFVLNGHVCLLYNYYQYKTLPDNFRIASLLRFSILFLWKKRIQRYMQNYCIKTFYSALKNNTIVDSWSLFYNTVFQCIRKHWLVIIIISFDRNISQYNSFWIQSLW